MHVLEVIGFFPKGVKPKDIFYDQVSSVSLPVEGPATIDVIEDGERREEVLDVRNFPVNHIEVPDALRQGYLTERQKRRSPELGSPYVGRPNELIANLLEFRLDSNGVLHWTENLTDFSTLNGVLRPGLLADFPDEQDRVLRGLAPTAPASVVESKDGYIILGVRGGTVHAQGRIMPFPAGHPRYNRNRNSQRSYLEDPLQALSRQVVTELNLPLYSGDMNSVFGAVKDITLIGAVRGRNRQAGSWNPAVTFVVESKWDARQLEEGYSIAVDKYEHERFLTLPIDPLQVTEFIRQNYARLVDNGLGELLVHGRFRFGDSWYEHLVHELGNERYGATLTERNPFK